MARLTEENNLHKVKIEILLDMLTEVTENQPKGGQMGYSSGMAVGH